MADNHRVVDEELAGGVRKDSRQEDSPGPGLLPYGGFRQRAELTEGQYDRVIEASKNLPPQDLERARKELVDHAPMPFGFEITDKMAGVYHAFSEVVPHKRDRLIWKRTELLIYFGVLIS